MSKDLRQIIIEELRKCTNQRDVNMLRTIWTHHFNGDMEFDNNVPEGLY